MKLWVYDEMVASDGTVRPHWQDFLGSIEAMAGGELDRRWRSAERLLRENGLTYDSPAEAEGGERPWELDAVPLLIPADEWERLEQGLIQRAHLLNALLRDLYGPQALLKEGVLPPALALGNPKFLRPCFGIEPRDGMFLHYLAVDLGRAPDGGWWVLGDHGEAPSGGGYALENRVILSHCFPELFRTCRVRRLARHFQSLHETLVARTGRDNPRIIQLTAGAGAKAYFADAYVARYLGYTQAEGLDLTVRDNRVYLKTLDGLQPVDLIVRRVNHLCFFQL